MSGPSWAAYDEPWVRSPFVLPQINMSWPNPRYVVECETDSARLPWPASTGARGAFWNAKFGNRALRVTEQQLTRSGYPKKIRLLQAIFFNYWVTYTRVTKQPRNYGNVWHSAIVPLRIPVPFWEHQVILQHLILLYVYNDGKKNALLTPFCIQGMSHLRTPVIFGTASTMLLNET